MLFSIILCLIIILKYIMILIGYVGCYFVSRYMKSKNSELDYFNKEQIINKNLSKVKFSSRGGNYFAISLKKYFSRIVNGWIRYSIIFTGKIPSHNIRKFIYKNIYKLEFGKNTIIYGGSEIKEPYNIKIGDGSIIGDDCKLDGRNGIIIGKNVNFSTGVWIWTEQHNPQSPSFSCDYEGAPVIIGDRAWLSCRTIILPGVTIGEGAVIAAGAVVTKDVEPFSIYGGIPARKIGMRNKNLMYDFDGKFIPFY